MKSILIGSVNSSKVILEEMVRCQFPIDFVFGLDEAVSENVSGFVSLCDEAEKYNIEYKRFMKINSPENIKIIKEIEPDYIFVIGLSQLVGKEIIDCAKKGVIGFHPAPLPKYRGRASVVWQMLCGEKDSACTLFKIDEGVDSGEILGQEPYEIGDHDYAADVIRILENAFRILCSKTLPKLIDGTIQYKKQNEEDATYTLRRIETDGQIDWQDSIEKIYLLIRAASNPYPGAFSYYDGKHKIIFNKADVLENKKYIGFRGQIAHVCEDYFDIVVENKLLRVWDYMNTDSIKIREGHRFKEVLL